MGVVSTFFRINAINYGILNTNNWLNITFIAIKGGGVEWKGGRERQGRGGGI